jgi:hypothetical protein
MQSILKRSLNSFSKTVLIHGSRKDSVPLVLLRSGHTYSSTKPTRIQQPELLAMSESDSASAFNDSDSGADAYVVSKKPTKATGSGASKKPAKATEAVKKTKVGLDRKIAFLG